MKVYDFIVFTKRLAISISLFYRGITVSEPSKGMIVRESIADLSDASGTLQRWMENESIDLAVFP